LDQLFLCAWLSIFFIVESMMSSGSTPIRVLVVDDSFFMRQVVSRMFQEQPEFLVVGTASNGNEAIRKNIELLPDVVTLDVEMPELNGLGALEQMLQTRPVAVVMLSAHTGAGKSMAVLALEQGALECVGKPTGSVSLDLRKIQDELLEKTRSAAKVPVALIRPLNPTPVSLMKPSALTSLMVAKRHIPAQFAVAVASSTGGPKALHELMSYMPRDPKACFLFVQHMALGFTAALARRLNDTAPFSVKEAEEGELLMQGVGYVAPGGKHLIVVKGDAGCQVGFNDGPTRHGVKPCADFLLASVAQNYGVHSVGVVLTGMGRDGSKGLLDMKQAGAYTYAQSEDTCVVFGMPKAAIECGAVDEVLSLEAMGKALRTRLESMGR
jgi:two-component system chemotaxis response regulator CheB